MKTHGANNRQGFTLLEILVVIGVIAILAGMLLPAMHLVRERAKKAKTKALIGNISVAVKAYESDWGAWPQITGMAMCSNTPSAANRLVASKVLFFLLSTDFHAGTAVSTPTGASVGTITPSMTAGPYLELAEGDYDLSGVERNIIDAWGNNLAYNADTDYNSGSTPPNNNKSSFDIWSPGADGVTSNSSEKEDDINNW